jgi:pimeloyl-ACP methyl ester carboxylesterase
MVLLSSDHSFHYELLRVINLASCGGADIGEVFATADEITPGDFESFFAAFNKRAGRIVKQAEQMKNPISIRDAMFRAANYFRFADFFVHADWDDPRITQLWDKQTACFDRAMSVLPVPGKRGLIPTQSGFDIPIIFFSANNNPGEKRPTIVMASGFDGSMEETWHVHGMAALERGYNVVCYEGPGQQYVRRSQGHGFILEWEKVVTPLLDHLQTIPCVDTTKVALIGYSLGGFLGARAAAFEHRLAALILIDGWYDLSVTPFVATLREFAERHLSPDADEAAIQTVLQDPTKAPTTLRWMFMHGLWSFNTKSPSDFVERLSKFSLVGLTDKIQCPVLVCDPVDDHFAKGQPKLVADALGDKATHVVFTKDDAAGEHCHIGASRFTNQIIYDWFEEKIVNK